uniref:Uncharacterized protein LOC105134973 n=1 Tax=Rhizophora mucronata TaxID=61149 RepID=A0A2P2JVL1_RHIMU
MQLASKYQHHSRKPYKDQDMQDTVEENLGRSPPELQGVVHLDLFLLLLILWVVQTQTVLYVAPDVNGDLVPNRETQKSPQCIGLSAQG